MEGLKKGDKIWVYNGIGFKVLVLFCKYIGDGLIYKYIGEDDFYWVIGRKSFIGRYSELEPRKNIKRFVL